MTIDGFIMIFDHLCGKQKWGWPRVISVELYFWKISIRKTNNGRGTCPTSAFSLQFPFFYIVPLTSHMKTEHGLRKNKLLTNKIPNLDCSLKYNLPMPGLCLPKIKPRIWVCFCDRSEYSQHYIYVYILVLQQERVLLTLAHAHTLINI